MKNLLKTIKDSVYGKLNTTDKLIFVAFCLIAFAMAVMVLVELVSKVM